MNTKSTSIQDHGRALLNRLTAFLGQYLSCSPDQLDLLALWTLHTYCFPSAPASPYLYIHSREKQSGKTLCGPRFRQSSLSHYLSQNQRFDTCIGS